MLTYAEANQADYVLGEVFQDGSRISDAVPIVFTVSRLAAPEGSMTLVPALLDDAANKACWHADRGLYGRLTQIRRTYNQRSDGDWAVVHRKSEVTPVDHQGLGLAINFEDPASYCENYE